MSKMKGVAGPLAAAGVVLLGLGVLVAPLPDPKLENVRTGLEDHQAQMEAIAEELRLVALCLSPDVTDPRCIDLQTGAQTRTAEEASQ